MWQAKADNVISMSALPATAVGQKALLYGKSDGRMGLSQGLLFEPWYFFELSLLFGGLRVKRALLKPLHVLFYENLILP